MSASAPRLSIVVPAFNEAGRIGPTLDAVLSALSAADRWSEVIVVDDGSADDTASVALRAAAGDRRLRVIRLPDNRGKGYAVRTGMANALGERVLFADADGATPIAELARLEAALDAGADVAIGSRALAGAGVHVETNPGRRISGRLFHQLVRAAGIRGIADTQCGFKLFTARAAADLFPRLRLTGYAFDVELLLAAQRRALNVAEVPINWTHQAGSKVHVLRDGLRMARDVIRIRSYALGGGYGRRSPIAGVVATS